MSTTLTKPERVDTIVIGGGQAGLSTGYHLRERGVPFLILDASARVGDAWRNRWDSLRLFTPARYTGLPGVPFPARGDSFPNKDQMASYLESYAEHFKFPIRTGVKVERLSRQDGHFVVTAGAREFEARNVVVAMSNYQEPKIPTFARSLDPAIRQLHSRDYRNPSQLRDGGVLVVGVGNSGADIAIEIAKTHKTWISGKESGSIPVSIDTWFARFVVSRIVRFVGHHVLNTSTRVGRNARPKLLKKAAALIRVKPEDLIEAGIERVPRVVGVGGWRPLLEDNRTLDVANVIWCTGFRHDFPWIDLPVFDKDGEPVHERGVVHNVPGLYFVGLHFLYAMSSATLVGVSRDAEYVADVLASRAKVGRGTAAHESVEVAIRN
jgi:putative flavoprotein involved in K+ transport